MVKVYLDFSPTVMTMSRQTTYQARVVLLRRIKIRVPEWVTVVVGPFGHSFGIVPAPAFQSLLLYVAAGALPHGLRKNRRLEVVGQADDQVTRFGP
jgi:hypothetical protein